MANCVVCFHPEKNRTPNGEVHIHNQKDVEGVLCGDCVQKLMRLTNKIPWDTQVKEVIPPKINGYRRKNTRR